MVDQFQGLRRIGVDEIAYKKGHRYHRGRRGAVASSQQATG